MVSGRHVTPQYTFHAKSQEIMLKAGPDNSVEAGDPFTVVVDTTPSQTGRADLPPPAIPGRTVTLQRRVNTDEWQTMDQEATDVGGFARFTVTATIPGTVVYRARQENWTGGGDEDRMVPVVPDVRRGAPAGATRGRSTRHRRTATSRPGR